MVFIQFIKTLINFIKSVNSIEMSLPPNSSINFFKLEKRLINLFYDLCYHRTLSINF